MSNPSTRRDFVKTAGAIPALPQLASAAQAPAEKKRKPNLIFFMPDELRAESLACYGHPLVKTPHFDKLAADGVRFEQCHVQNTVCAPSRCSMMTGWPVHVRGHRSLYYGLHPDEPNLLRYLKEDGYDVYFFGKNDLLSPDSFPQSVTEWDSKTGDRSGYRNPWKPDDPLYYSFLYNKTPDRRKTSDYENLQRALQIISTPQEKPFCIYLPLIFPHPPFGAPEDFHDMYKASDLPTLRPPGLPRKPNFHEAIRKTRKLDQLSDKDFRRIQAVYLGMVSYSDWLLGELLEAVDKSNHRDDTAIFTFADHGEWAGDFGLVEKWPSAMDDTLTHIPLIARVPGNKAGHVSKEIVELYDVMATCLELAGIPARHTHFAKSLSPQLSGKPGDPQRAAFCEGGYNTYEPQCFEPLQDFSSPENIYYPKVKLQNEHPETITRSTMIRTLDTKLIARPDGQSELYDLRRDPRELHNVFGERSYGARQSALEARMLNWYIRTGDVAPRQLDPRGFPTPAQVLKMQTTRRHFLSTAAAAATGLGAPQRSSAKTPRPPNVLFILPDEWRAQSTGYNGDPNVLAPVLDRLAHESVSFDNAVAGTPVCCPARASLMTGQYPLRNGVFINDVELTPNAPTLAEVFRAAGYRTGYIGKWHLYGSPDGNYGRRLAYIPPEKRLGFDYWKACECSHEYNHSLYFEGNDPTPKYWPGYDADSQADDACRFMEQQAKTGQAFFLCLSLGPPHFPYETAPERFRTQFANRPVQFRPNVPEARRKEAEPILRGYFAHMAAVDACLARLLATLDRSGIAEDTIVVFTSDHGDMMWSQGITTKLHPWDESIRIPFLVRYPRKLGRRGRRLKTPLNHPDIMPTLLHLAGRDVPGAVQGTDYSGLLTGRADRGNKAALLSLPVPITEARRWGFAEYRGLRTERHTYVRSIKGPWLLYDNASDPYQKQNLIGRAEHRALQSSLDRTLDQRLKDVGDQFLPAAEYVRRAGLGHYKEVNAPVGHIRSPWGDWGINAGGVENIMRRREFLGEGNCRRRGAADRCFSANHAEKCTADDRGRSGVLPSVVWRPQCRDAEY